MTNQNVSIKTEFGVIAGRDSFYIDTVELEDDCFSIKGSINTSNFSDYKGTNEFLEFSITFNNVIAQRSVEIDDWKGECSSCFNKVYDSDWLKSILTYDKEVKEMKNSDLLKHFILLTYDEAFEIISTGYDLKFIN